MTAGHICVDIIPRLIATGKTIADIMIPGKLIDVESTVVATGGSASNTGQALHRLGFSTSIAGKVGKDLFGDAIIDLTRKAGGDAIAADMIIDDKEASSYTVIINPPGIDRIFIHCTGANDTFVSSDLTDDKLKGLQLFHFGYPPLMRSMFERDGAECRSLMSRARAAGATTSLDMARPDPQSRAGKVDWLRYLDNVLPFVDVFQPSIEEIIFMLDRSLFDRLMAQSPGGELIKGVNGEILRWLSSQLLAKGPAIVGIKLGDQGYYLAVHPDVKRLEAMGPLSPNNPEEWRGKHLLSPCFDVTVEGTTGSGDCTIAGFLGALMKKCSPERALRMAVGVGASSVEKADATGGVPKWEVVEKRINEGWKMRECSLKLEGWSKTANNILHP